MPGIGSPKCCCVPVRDPCEEIGLWYLTLQNWADVAFVSQATKIRSGTTSNGLGLFNYWWTGQTLADIFNAVVNEPIEFTAGDFDGTAYNKTINLGVSPTSQITFEEVGSSPPVLYGPFTVNFTDLRLEVRLENTRRLRVQPRCDAECPGMTPVFGTTTFVPGSNHQMPFADDSGLSDVCADVLDLTEFNDTGSSVYGLRLVPTGTNETYRWPVTWDGSFPLPPMAKLTIDPV